MIANMRNVNFWLKFSVICLLALLSLSSLALAIEPDIYEEDNNHYQARFITLNCRNDSGTVIYNANTITSNEHNFHQAGDEDWFMVELVSGKSYHFDIKAEDDPASSDFKPVVELYRPDAITSVSLDAMGSDRYKTTKSIPKSDYYYVRVKNLDADKFGGGMKYSFTLTEDSGQSSQGLFYGFVYDADTKDRIPNATISIVSDHAGQSWNGTISDVKYSGQSHSGFVGFYMSPTLLGSNFTITVDAGVKYDSYTRTETIDVFNFIKWLDIYLSHKATDTVSIKKVSKDADNDGRGNRLSTYECMECTPLSGYCEDCAGDCDDQDSSVHPDEICGNGKDDNCDGRVDEAACIQEGSSVTSTIATTSTTISQATTTTTSITTFQPVTTTTLVVLYRDADGDGYGNPGDQTSASVLSAGWVQDNTDCNDADSNEHPGQLWYKDADDDKYSDGGFATSCLRPSGYKVFSELSATSGDCNDSNPSINPGSKELCNGLDDNCNGQYEEGLPKNTYYMDADGDGYGHHDITTVPYCTAPVGFVENNRDCDDSDPAIHPYAKEICNDKDDNCNGETDEALKKAYCRDADSDGFGDPNEKKMFCSQPDGYTEEDFCDDCDDSDSEEYPGQVWFKDKDGDGYADGYPNDPDGYLNGKFSLCERAFPYYYLASPGSKLVFGDCNDDEKLINPDAPEVCNGKDDNCNGEADEGLMLIFYKDADNDGHGNPDDKKEACEQPEGYVSDNTDCDDTDPAIHLFTYCKDADGDGYGSPNEPLQACSLPAGQVEDQFCNDCDDTDPQINPVSLGNAVSILKKLIGWDMECWSDKNGDGKAGLDDVILILGELTK